MNTFRIAASQSMVIAAVALLGGCVGAEPDEGGGGEAALDTQPEVAAEVAVETSGPAQGEAQGGPELTAKTASTLTAWHCVTGACARFEAYGDHLYVADTVADGHSAVGQISGYNACWNRYGAGTTVDCNYDTAEATIFFRVCTGEYSTKKLLSCTGWIKTSAAN